MFFISEKKLEQKIREGVASFIGDIVTIDPEKSYIFVLPTDIDPMESSKAFEILRGKVNYLVIHTDSMKVVELE